MVTAGAPGLYFEAAATRDEPSVLRTDVAGFIGPTRRGPIGEAVRCRDARRFDEVFGGLDPAADTTYSIGSYFENGGRVAWVVRVAGSDTTAASAAWRGPADIGSREAFGLGNFVVNHFELRASSPGSWANGSQVLLGYRRNGILGSPEIDFEIRVPGEPPERLPSLPAADAETLCRAVNEGSRYIRLLPDLTSLQPVPAGSGASHLTWNVILGAEDLRRGVRGEPGRIEYLEAVSALARVPEVALVVLPDLYRNQLHDHNDSADPDGQVSYEILRAAVAAADERHDQLVVADLPMNRERSDPPLDAGQIARIVGEVIGVMDPQRRRALAVYHPPVWVSGPPGIESPERLIPVSGSVAGLMSRLDRERGPHHSPANARLYDAVDVAGSFVPTERARLNELGVNLVRCFPNRGLLVWGARTMQRAPEGRFVAHRRLIPRLVRAIRRVAEPLVFDSNGPALWLNFVRAITSVLLEAYRDGALKGARPEEAFRVKCDEETNPPPQREAGQVVCEVEVAPAAPMEFITLRIALGREGQLEVFEP